MPVFQHFFKTPQFELFFNVPKNNKLAVSLGLYFAMRRAGERWEMKSRPRSRIEEGEELRLRARHLRRRLRDIGTDVIAFEEIEGEFLYIKGRAAELEKTRPGRSGGENGR